MEWDELAKEKKAFKGFYIIWPGDLVINRVSHFSNFGTESPKDHSYEVLMESGNSLRRSRLLKDFTLFDLVT